jgi:hypothetical protein
MRLAWFSPMPPARSGVAACSAELVRALRGEHAIDVYVDEPVAALARSAGVENWMSAHDFVWRHRLHPYDLTVYQLGNSSHHDYLWPYLFRYPGLAVLHDTHLHHARAASLLRTQRADDYRAEFVANHPDSAPALAELAVAGFDNHLYYDWPMTRLVVERSRLAAVHTPIMAAALNAERWRRSRRSGSPTASVSRKRPLSPRARECGPSAGSRQTRCSTACSED